MPVSSSTKFSEAIALGADPAQRVSTAKELSNFFSVLCVDVLKKNADIVFIRRVGEALNVIVVKGEDEETVASMHPSWADALGAWLKDRSFFPSIFQAAAEEPQQGAASIFPCALRLENSVVTFRARRFQGRNAKTAFQFNEFREFPYREALSRLGLDAPSYASFDALTTAERGVIIVGGPDEQNKDRAVSSILSITRGEFVGSINEDAVRGVLEDVSGHTLVVVSAVGLDAVDVLVKLRASGISLGMQSLLGVICIGFLKATCKDCARETVPPSQAIAQLPIGLQPTSGFHYHVGRGCDHCGHTGYAGMVGVPSFFRIDEEFKHIHSGTSLDHDYYGKFVNYLYPRGAKPLLEVGVDKVIQGSTTFEALFSLIKIVPDAYQKHLAKGQLTSIQEMEAMLIDGDFTAKAGASGEQQPIVGRAAFKNAPTADGDMPLFAGQSPVVKREKPLLLVIEDDADQRGILETVLKSENYEVRIAFDGVNGMEELAKEVPDLIMCDVMMPRMDGLEFVKRVKKNAAYKHIPILVLTVLSDPDKEFELLDLGADDYCEKSVQRKLLLKRVQRLLKRSK